MPETGDRQDHNPENKSEFERFNLEHNNDPRRFGGEWRNKMADSGRRFINSVRNRKIFPRSK